jgi:hypothetical protein
MLHAVFQDKSVSEAREMVMRSPLGRGDFIFYAQSQTSSYPDHIEHGHVVCDLVRETEVVAENIWKLYERRDAVSRRSSSFRFKPGTCHLSISCRPIALKVFSSSSLLNTNYSIVQAHEFMSSVFVISILVFR